MTTKITRREKMGMVATERGLREREREKGTLVIWLSLLPLISVNKNVCVLWQVEEQENVDKFASKMTEL